MVDTGGLESTRRKEEIDRGSPAGSLGCLLAEEGHEEAETDEDHHVNVLKVAIHLRCRKPK